MAPRLSTMMSIGIAATVAWTSTKGRRARGHIRRRGGSFQVLVYAGTDPLRTHEAEETTLDGYRGYLRRTIEPALGPVPLAQSPAAPLLLRDEEVATAVQGGD